jgi:hypothetical protein
MRRLPDLSEGWTAGAPTPSSSLGRRFASSRGHRHELAAALGLGSAELATHLSGCGAGLARRLQERLDDRACVVSDCTAPRVARGWCWRHYQRWRNHGDPLAWVRPAAAPRPRIPRPTVEERFWRRVDKHASGCWLWTGCVREDGYGRFYLKATREQRAHTFAYCLAHGPLPLGQVLVNRCGHRACVNPEHWQPATRGEVARAWRAARKLRDGP